MTRPIRLLDSQTADRIAAGEVVERPASVVKELVENALDAGATAVTVDISGGGIDRIRVTDNGSGIPEGDVRLAFERHATSKIASGDDLTHIATLGFRGEALPSIASVAKVRMTTRFAGADAGVLLRIEGGAVQEVRPAGCPQGTSVVVEDLFYNTPARRKFLRKAATETGHIADSLMALALSRPALSLRFSQDGRTVFQTAGDGKLESAAYTLFGSRTAGEMLPVRGQSGYVKVEGLVGVGQATRSGRDYEFTFVGGRVVRSVPLYQGIETAVRERVMIGKCPVCALNVTVPDACVDVNCHPAKTEVRFSDEAYVRQAVYDVVSQCVQTVSSRSVMEGFQTPEPPAQPSEPKTAQLHRDETSPRLETEPSDAPAAGPEIPAVRPEKNVFSPAAALGGLSGRPLGAFPKTGALGLSDGGAYLPPAAAQPQAAAAPAPAVQPVPPEPEEPVQLSLAAGENRQEPGYTLMGQVFDTYLFLKTRSAVVIIDQHAAHERILYDRYTALCGTEALSQTLLIPMVFDVTYRDKQRILDSAQDLAQAGFTVEEFGPSQVRVVSVPVILGQPYVKSFFDELVTDLDEWGTIQSAQERRKRIIRLACRKAVKGGDPLTREEIESLLALLRDSDSPPTCPHGRPIFVQIDEKELQRRFKRIV